MKLQARTFAVGAEQDSIVVRNLRLTADVGSDCWSRQRAQLITLSLRFSTSLAAAGGADALGQGVDYGAVCKDVSRHVKGHEFGNLAALAEHVAEVALHDTRHGTQVSVCVEKPRALLCARTVGVHLVRRASTVSAQICKRQNELFIDFEPISAIIGVHPHERDAQQPVQVYIRLCELTGEMGEPQIRAIASQVCQQVGTSSFHTLEALVEAVARTLCTSFDIPKVTVRIEKPRAIAFAESAGVEITRRRDQYSSVRSLASPGRHIAYIGLGGNMGDRLAYINKALHMMEQRNIRVRRTSSLYESQPMYYMKQSLFLNAVCMVDTELEPEKLLEQLQSIEEDLKRVKTIDKGPRTIDLDILLYDNMVMASEQLTIPHVGMLERPFVLRPMCDIASDLSHPQTDMSFASHLSACDFNDMSIIVPHLSEHNGAMVMAIHNLTPDSFSDGGKQNPQFIVDDVRRYIVDGASIIDIGGHSVRPFATDVPVDVELARVIPAIQQIRKAGIRIPISVDTFRAEVAQAAVKAGANIINDVSAGQWDEAMLSTTAALDVPIVLMHMRGDVNTMNTYAHYDDVIEEVGRELEERVEAAMNAGVRRWNIILDPGLGLFAKNTEHNIEIIRRLNELKRRPSLVGIPWLLGPSRKTFIGKLTGISEPSHRTHGTVAAVTACIAGGANIVRVHDVQIVADAVKVANALWDVS